MMSVLYEINGTTRTAGRSLATSLTSSTSRLSALEIAQSERAARCRSVRRYRRQLLRARRLQGVYLLAVAFLLLLTAVVPKEHSERSNRVGAQSQAQGKVHSVLHTPQTLAPTAPAAPATVSGTRVDDRQRPESAKKGARKIVKTIGRQTTVCRVYCTHYKPLFAFYGEQATTAVTTGMGAGEGDDASNQ